ncbi:hypothetical protein ABEB36_012683 [Hypothenemus hampei]|uniref:Uncharacterized protein n=1 Tax=Hypothenemus hampei TaxID=57062 RepID=A0ABD1EC25_HYPHA
MINEAYTIMKEMHSERSKKDVFSIFGEEVAVTLRTLPTSYAQATVQHMLSKIMYEAKLGMYNYYPIAEQPQQQYFPHSTNPQSRNPSTIKQH